MALFAPEIVLYTAYSQYVEARDLVKELNRIRFGEENGSSDDTEKGISSANGPRSGAGALDATERYGLRYGFFIVMGGCITRDVENLSDQHTNTTITPKGAIALAREGLFIDISPETISDKSKANLIGKSLVCTQALWFAVQCIARAISSYPLVLIEVHTMVHVVCAITMYMLWWEVSNDN